MYDGSLIPGIGGGFLLLSPRPFLLGKGARLKDQPAAFPPPASRCREKHSSDVSTGSGMVAAILEISPPTDFFELPLLFGTKLAEPPIAVCGLGVGVRRSSAWPDSYPVGGLPAHGHISPQ